MSQRTIAQEWTQINAPTIVSPGMVAQTAWRKGDLTAIISLDGGRRQAPEPGEPNAFHPLGRNKRTVWEIATHPFPEAHFATFPEKLVEPCVLAGCPRGGVVLDPFCGSGTTLLVANREAVR